MSASAPEPVATPESTTVLRRNLSLCVGEGLAAMPIVFITLPGNFIIAMLLTQTFPLRDAVFGAIASLPAWCNVIQILVVPLLTKRWSQKSIALTFSWFHLAVWVAIGFALPHVPREDLDKAGGLFFALFALSAMSHAVVGVSWTSWVQEWVPDRLRGNYFGRRNRLLQLSTVLFLLVAGELLTRFDARESVVGFQCIVGLSVFLRVLSILAQQRILATSARQQTETAQDTGRQLRLIFRHKPLVWLFGFGVAFGFATNVFGPFFNVFLYDGLGRSVGDVSMLIIITNVTGAISLPAWGQMISRFGSRPTMNVALAAWVIPGYLWATLTPDNLWILKFLFASGGIFSAGFILGSFNILLRLVPPEAKTTAISMNVAATSLAAAIAPIIGGFLLEYAWSAGWSKLTAYHTMAIVHHTLVLSSGLVLLKVAEPNSAPLGKVVGAMRSYRQIGALLGMTFLVNYVFTKQRPDENG